jgi:undecaprenyl-diphosphatase
MSRNQDLERAPAVRGQGRAAVRWPGTGLWFLLVLPVVLFVAITWQVVSDGPLLGVDRRVSQGLLHPDRASELLADLGNVPVAGPALAVVLGCVAWRGWRAAMERWWVPPLAAALLMALLPALVLPVKAWTARQGTSAVPAGAGYYPSGHTATAAVGYGAAVLVLLPWLRTALARRAVVAGGALLVLGVSYGLVRRGYHWPLDVVASWCLCTVLLSLLHLVIGLFGRSRSRSIAGTAGSRTGPG